MIRCLEWGRRAIAIGIWRAVLLLAGIGVIWGLAGAATVEAHAFLQRSDPPVNAILPVAPGTVSLWFTEDLEPSATSARLVNQLGEDVPGSSFEIGAPDQLIVTLPGNLTNGTYSIVWRNISTEDGHPANGYLPFTIGTSADVQEVAIPVDAAESAGAPQWLRTTSRWVAFLGLFCAVAVWPLWSLVLAPSVRGVPGALRAALPVIDRVAIGAMLLSLIGNLFAFLVQAAEPGGRYLDAVWTTLEETRYGTLMIWRMGLLTLHALILSFVNWRQPWQSRELGALAMISSVALVAPFSFNAHAAAQTAGRGFAIASDAVHLASAGLWGGGAAVLVAVIAALWRTLPATEARAVAAAAIPRFSALAIAAWICLAATGIYAAWLQVGSLEAARETAYGTAFIVKLALAVLLLGFGAFHLLFITRRIARQTTEGQHWTGRLRQSLGVEVVLLVAILLVTGWLTSKPPAREALPVAPVEHAISLPMQANGLDGTLVVTPGVAGQNEIRLTLASDEVPADVEALLRLSSPDTTMGTQEITLEPDPTSANAWSISGSQLSITGDWSITAIVRKVGEFQWQASTRATVASEAAAPAGDEQDVPWHFENWAIAGLVVLVAGSIAVGYRVALGRGGGTGRLSTEPVP